MRKALGSRKAWFLMALIGLLCLFFWNSSGSSRFVIHIRPSGKKTGYESRGGQMTMINFDDKKSLTYYDYVPAIKTGDNKIVNLSIEAIHQDLFKPLKPPDEKPRKRYPDCILIGVHKCGTRELTQFLHLHPKVQIYHHISFEMPYFKSSYFKGKRWFRSQMPTSYSNQITVMKNSVYFTTVSRNIPARIKKFNRNIKMILMVREPVSRVISQYMYDFQRNLIKPGTALEELIIQNNSINENHNFVKDSVYDEPMEKWLKYFKLEQFLIIDANEFKSNPAQVLTKVEDFLDLEHYITPDMFVWNKEKGYNCIRSNLTDTGMACYSSGTGKKQINVNPQTAVILKDYYKEKNERFFKLIGRSFPWH